MTLAPNEENEDFYESLALDYTQLDGPETCSICFKKTDELTLQCPNCETRAHKSCLLDWIKVSHVGPLYMGRCHMCHALIKLDKDKVYELLFGLKPLKNVKKRDIIAPKEYLNLFKE